MHHHRCIHSSQGNSASISPLRDKHIKYTARLLFLPIATVRFHCHPQHDQKEIAFLFPNYGCIRVRGRMRVKWGAPHHFAASAADET